MDQFRFIRLKKDFDAEVIPVPLELRPSIAQEGVSAKERDLGHSDRVERRLVELAAAEGEEMFLPDLVPNTHLALILGEYGRDLGEDVYWPLHLDIFRAYYVHGEDLGDREVLLDVARAHDLDVEEVEAAWDEDTYEERLHEFHHMVVRLGVDQTPAALICNELLIGTRPYGLLRDAVQRCLVRPETLDEVWDSDNA